MNWNWTEKEKEALDRVVVSTQAQDDLVLAVANKAAELLAARGGTMTADNLRHYLQHRPELSAHISAIGARNAALEAELENYRNPRCQRQECARERERVDTLEQQRRLDMEHQELTRREIGALPGETVMGAARRLFQERKTLEAERDTLSQRLTETNQRAQENWERQEERLQASIRESDRLRTERDAALKRAEAAEARVRQLAIAGQELSAAVAKHDGGIEYDLGDGPFMRYPCSPTCTHDDAALPGHAGVIAEPNVSTASNGSEPITGHPERVKERSEAVEEIGRSPENDAATFVTIPNGVEGVVFTRSQTERYADKRAEAMRAACWEAVQEALRFDGVTPEGQPGMWHRFKAAIEGATP